MNVVLLAPTPPPAGGISSWTERMQKTILKNGWRVEVVDEKLIGGRTIYGSTSKKKLSVEIRRCFRIWRDLYKALKNKENVIVQACIPAGLFSMLREIISLLITKLHRRKFIIHFRCTVPNMIHNSFTKMILKVFVSMSDCVFLLNQQSMDYMMKIAPKSRYELIPNFVEATEGVTEKHIKANIENIVYVGGVIPEKGCERIISLAKIIPNINFRLIGKVGIDTNNIPNNVILCGEKTRSEVHDELLNADVFIFLSKFPGEGFSNALAEAMAYSLPCIVTDWAANADMIEQHGGVIIKGDADEEVVEAITSLQNANVRKKMGYWNREKVMVMYSEKKITDMYVDVYENLIK